MQQMQRQVLAEMLESVERLCVSAWADTLPCLCRFIRNQLVVEITSSARLAHLFGWALKKHTILAFMLYTAGECSLPKPSNSHREMITRLFTKIRLPAIPDTAPPVPSCQGKSTYLSNAEPPQVHRNSI